LFDGWKRATGAPVVDDPPHCLALPVEGSKSQLDFSQAKWED
jgi:hypothetical protein